MDIKVIAIGSKKWGSLLSYSLWNLHDTNFVNPNILVETNLPCNIVDSFRAVVGHFYNVNIMEEVAQNTTKLTDQHIYPTQIYNYDSEVDNNIAHATNIELNNVLNTHDPISPSYSILPYKDTQNGNFAQFEGIQKVTGNNKTKHPKLLLRYKVGMKQ